MKCRNCGEEYNEELFPVCPFCLTQNERYGGEEMDQPAVTIQRVISNETDKIEENDNNELNTEVVDEYCQTDDNIANVSCTEDSENNISIDDVDFFSKRMKNLLHRNGIFTIGEFRKRVEEGNLNQINGLGKQGENELFEAYQDLLKESPKKWDDPGLLRIESVFNENKYNLFVKYCFDHGIEYMADLDGFVFEDLSSVRGIGKGKIEEIIKLYEKYDSGEFENDSQGNENNPFVIERLFLYINDQLSNLTISLLTSMGLSSRTVTSLIQRGYNKIGDLQTISRRNLEDIVGKRNIYRFETIEEDLKCGLFDLFGKVLTGYSVEEDFQLDIKKANGYTLQQLGDESHITRERVRQKIVKFNQRIAPFMEAIVDSLIYPKNYITVQELLDIYDNDDFDKVVLYWCMNADTLEFLDFADVFVFKRLDNSSTESNIYALAEDFIGEGIDLYENLEDLELLMESNGYPYVDGSVFINLVRKHGYKVYGDYVVKGKKSYGYLCAKLVATCFPNGIKLYDSTDLNKLRELVRKQYGEIGVSDDDRAFSTRLSEFLVLSGRGMATAESNIHVEMTVLDEIKDYIDTAPEGEFYYSELFSRFEGMLRMMSNVDNYNFLHGVLKLYYSDEYDFSNRDYLKKKGVGYKSGRLSDRIKEFIRSKGVPVSRHEIKNHVLGLTDIVLSSALIYDSSLFQWDYNFYFTLDLLNIGPDDIEYLQNTIEGIMQKTNGYCSDNLLYDMVSEERGFLLERNKITNSNNLYYVCQKIFSANYDFRRPHIGRKGMFDEISVKNVALYLMGYPHTISFKSYQKIADDLKWPAATVGIVFSEIEKDYIRISDDSYVQTEDFIIDDQTICEIEEKLRNCMTEGFLSLINFDEWDSLPELKYEWNVFLLRSIVGRFLESFKVIETRAKDRRYERGILVDRISSINDYPDLIALFLKNRGISEISENTLLTLLIVNNLTYKLIPKELYSSDRITFEDEKFKIQ